MIDTFSSPILNDGTCDKEKEPNTHIFIDGLSAVGSTPDGQGLVFLKMTIMNRGLDSLNGIEKYKYLQFLNAPGNHIEDLSPLNQLQYLVRVHLPNNQIRTLSNYKPHPFSSLRELDVSMNRLTSLDGIQVHRDLKYLCINDNRIQDLEPLKNNLELLHFYAKNNQINSLEHLSHLPLRILDLTQNQLKTLEGMKTMYGLNTFLAARNQLEQLDALHGSGHPYLETLDISHNQLSSPAELNQLQTLVMLRDLRIDGNSMNQLMEAFPTYIEERCVLQDDRPADRHYRQWVIYSLPQLVCLDGMPVTAEQKIYAKNQFEPLPEVIASVQHAFVTQKQMRTFASMRKGLNARVHRPIVLCGLRGSGKRSLTKRLLSKYGDKFVLIPSYTTRAPYSNEENSSYHFVSEKQFENILENEVLIAVTKRNKILYGSSLELIEATMENNRVGICNVEIEGAFMLRQSYLNPRCVHVTTPSFDDYLSRVTTDIQASDLTDLKKKYDIHQLYAGNEKIFDAVIVNEDLDQSFEQFERLCLQWYEESMALNEVTIH